MDLNLCHDQKEMEIWCSNINEMSLIQSTAYSSNWDWKLIISRREIFEEGEQNLSNCTFEEWRYTFHFILIFMKYSFNMKIFLQNIFYVCKTLRNKSKYIIHGESIINIWSEHEVWYHLLHIPPFASQYASYFCIF